MITAVGHLPGLAYWITERISGDPIDPDSGAVARFVPDVLRLNDVQAYLGTGDPRECRTWFGARSPPEAMATACTPRW